MTRIKGGIKQFALILLLAFIGSAQSAEKDNSWLPAGSVINAAPDHQPLETLDHSATPSFLVEYGRLAFRSPDILGGNARRAGLSCNSCHTNGHINEQFFIPGLSDRPGRVDVTHYLWNHFADNHQNDPRDIPSLRGVKTKNRFGFDLRSPSLREFTRSVIAVEFAGAEPDSLLLDALAAYETALTVVPDGTVDRQSVTAQTERHDLVRYLKALEFPLQAEDGPLAVHMISMIRGEIGRQYDQARTDLPKTQLTQWALTLGQISAEAEAKMFPQARAKLHLMSQDVASK